MAINDDPDWLLEHIKHSFITSDDTGMCEMVIIHDFDVKHLSEIRTSLKHKRNDKATRLKNETLRPSSFKDKASCKNTDYLPNASDASPGPYSPSPDIPTGWDFGVRRRSNTAQKLDRIKRERQNRIKVKKIPWRNRPNGDMTKEEMTEMFEKKLLLQKDSGENVEDENIEIEVNSQNPPTMENQEYSPNTIYRGFCVRKNEPSLVDSICDQIANNNQPELDEIIKTCKIIKNKKNEVILNDFKLRIQNDDGVINGAYRHFHTDVAAGDKNIKKSSEHKSMLSKQLLETEGDVKNPFKEYARFNGKGQEGTAPMKKINIFVWADATRKPKFSTVIDVVVLTQNAKIQDLIGLTCWLYSSKDHEPKLKSFNVKDYSLKIAEDDGSVDADFPALEAQKPVEKFGFTTLTMVQKQRILEGENCTEAKEAIFVKVNDHDGSSLIKVEDLNVVMGDILKKALKKRKGNKYPERYHLEYQNKHGTVVKEEETLESTGAMEFFLVRQHSSRNENGNGSIVDAAFPSSLPHFLPTKDYLFNEYRRFRLFHIQKLRSTEVALGVCATQIDIDPVTVKESKLTLLLSPRLKPLSISIFSIARCVMVESKQQLPISSSISVSPSSSSGGGSVGVSSSLTSFSSQILSSSNEKGVFKLYYKLPDVRSDFKHITLEGTRQVVFEAVEYIKQLMMLNGNLELQEAFKLSKFSGAEPVSTLSRRKSRKGNLFYKP